MRSLPSLLLALVIAAPAARSQESRTFRLERSISMPLVKGRIDHLAVDLHGNRLFVAALGNSTVEVIDLPAHRLVRSLSGFDEPQGLFYVPELERLFAANGGDGSCAIVDGKSLRVLDKIGLGDDADNVRFDGKTILVGYGGGALGFLDPTSNKKLGKIPLDGHPESFQLEKSGTRIFVNVPTARHIAVIDGQKRIVTAKWPVTQAADNFPMALDEANKRLFAGCRKPPKVVVFDTTSGKSVAEIPIDGDTDDLFYDASRKRLYVSCGQGFLDVIEQQGADHYERIERVLTVPGARTCLFVPALDRLYLAARRHETQPAEIRVYKAKP